MSATVATVLGAPVPPFTPHAISVSLPTWKDNVGYEEGEKRVVDSMVTGYPRFFIHRTIQKLASICEAKFGVNGERCLLLPTKGAAEKCRAFMLSRSNDNLSVRLVEFMICPEDKDKKQNGTSPNDILGISCIELHIVLFPADAFPIAKQFWQHAGVGISSRRAERCLSMLPDELTQASQPVPSPPPTPTARYPSKFSNRHYSARSISKLSSPPLNSPTPVVSPTATSPQPQVTPPETDVLSVDQSFYLEERYGRNLPLSAASAAKRAMRRRIAGTLVHDEGACSSLAGSVDVELGPSSRGAKDLTEEDVFLFPTGMAAIWSAHQLALSVRPAAKSICFGFPYADTLKILQKWGPGCWFFGHGLDSDIDELAKVLEEQAARLPGQPPALALFTEFPSNPLLRSPNLVALRALADKYDFLLVVDETIGNFVDVDVLPYADIVVSSLSKVFSGDSNVMGGSLVLNPSRRHYASLKSHLQATYEDLYFDEDAIYMERNSRNFRKRVLAINENTEAVCDFLRTHSVAGGVESAVIKDVYYPKWITPENYARCRLSPDGGFGGLFSLTFTSQEASRAFFDILPCNKGPSLGTNFTLASPYVVLAHYLELDWAAQFGVEEGLVRVSVGMEEREALLDAFRKALEAAEDTRTNN